MLVADNQSKANHRRVAGINRRGFLALLPALALTHLSLGGCIQRTPGGILRVASHLFPGYEPLHLAQYLNYVDPARVRLLDMPSATACLHALASGVIEGAGLTLDEVIAAHADNMPLKIVAVLDISLGADMLLARPGISSLVDLRGCRIGVEKSAVGAVMLDAVMERAGLTANDLKLVYATLDQHLALYEQGRIDAVMTFEPVARKILALGAKKLFDSAAVPGRIVDVLAVRPDVPDRFPEQLQALVSGHFRALEDLQSRQPAALAKVARRLGLAPQNVPLAYEGLQMLTEADNRHWLSGSPPPLLKVANDLQSVMHNAQLISRELDLSAIYDGRFLQ